MCAGVRPDLPAVPGQLLDLFPCAVTLAKEACIVPAIQRTNITGEHEKGGFEIVLFENWKRRFEDACVGIIEREDNIALVRIKSFGLKTLSEGQTLETGIFQKANLTFELVRRDTGHADVKLSLDLVISQYRDEHLGCQKTFDWCILKIESVGDVFIGYFTLYHANSRNNVPIFFRYLGEA